MNASTRKVSTQIIVDDTDPRILYDNNATWILQRITNVDFFSHPENGQVTPMYGTIHAILPSADNTTRMPNSTLRFRYDGSDFVAHFRAAFTIIGSEQPLCLLDGKPQIVESESNIFLCRNNETVEAGQHELGITFNTSNFYAFDYLTYTPSQESQLTGEDVMFASPNESIIDLKEPGSVFKYSFTGYSTGVYILYESRSNQFLGPSKMVYSIDDGTPFFFTFTNPINPSNPLGEPQLLLQTPRSQTAGEHSIVLQMITPGSQNQTPISIQSYVVQNSASSFDLNLTSVPVNENPILPSMPPADPSQLSSSDIIAFGWPKIVGTIVGGLVVGAILCIARILILRRRRRLGANLPLNTSTRKELTS